MERSHDWCALEEGGSRPLGNMRIETLLCLQKKSNAQCIHVPHLLLDFASWLFTSVLPPCCLSCILPANQRAPKNQNQQRLWPNMHALSLPKCVDSDSPQGMKRKGKKSKMCSYHVFHSLVEPSRALMRASSITAILRALLSKHFESLKRAEAQGCAFGA